MTAAGQTPEQRARQRIDAALTAADDVVQDRDEVYISAAHSVAIRSFALERDHGAGISPTGRAVKSGSRG